MIVRSYEDKAFPAFHVCDIKYLGHILTDNLHDDRGISRQRYKPYAQANMLLRRFSMCSGPVKCALFKAFCTPMNTAYLWCTYKKCSMQRLKVACNDALRILLKVPRDGTSPHI